MITYKPFQILFLHNFLRGFNAGIFSLMVTVGYHLNILDSVSSGYLIIITNATMIISCVFYSNVSKSGREDLLILISSIAMAVIMPLMCIVRNVYVFLIMYGIGYFFYNTINYSVPVLVARIVKYEIMGQYSAWRTILHTFGMAIAGVLCVPMLDALGTSVTFAIIGAMQLISGGVYFVYAAKIKKGIIV